MSYNGYGMDNDFGAYSGQHDPSYLGSAYGAAYGEALLTTDYKDTYRADALQFQRLLEAAGFGAQLGSKGADGYFGNNTAAATRAYQESVGLPQTGNADQATWDALQRTNPTRDAQRVSAADILDTAGDVVSRIFQPSGQASSPQTPPWLANIFGGGGTPAPAPSSTPAQAQQGGVPTWAWVVGGIAGVALVGGIVIAVTRKK